MRVITSGRGVHLTPEFRTLVERKLSKLTRVLPEPLEIRLVCEAEKFRRTARLTLRARVQTFASHATTGNLVTAVEEALEIVWRLVREAKERRRTRKRVA
ncbi:MAG TPA: HPF/RaiA family ribosome-associated protein [Methylomirabilota bacterium]|jgi:ribosomal subunit interface protein